MPTTTAGAHGADPFDQARLAARELLRSTGEVAHDVLVVLGTGLSPVAGLLGGREPTLDLTTLPWFPKYTGIGHRPDVWSIRLGDQRVLVAAGRLHLYEGRTPAEVVHPIRTAMAAGCHTVILTCSAGGIDPALPVGRVVAIADHLNLTATSPLTGIPADHPHGHPYVDLTDLWSPRLRQFAREVDPAVPEGVYAQLPGPHLETPAEIRMLATLGADMVGMSTVPEAIAARHLGAEILGLAVITNSAAGVVPGPVDVDHIATTAGGAAESIARLVSGVVSRLPPRNRPPAEQTAG